MVLRIMLVVMTFGFLGGDESCGCKLVTSSLLGAQGKAAEPPETPIGASSQRPGGPGETT
jgi:hypothetical protein